MVMADNYARRKTHVCLFGGCNKLAIGSHAIPRWTISEALADATGHLYTQDMSMLTTIKRISAIEPVNIIKIGVNDASVFKGYCAYHDAKLFESAESTDPNRKKGFFLSNHLRALSLEYARKRYVVDYYEKLVELIDPCEFRDLCKKNHDIFHSTAKVFGALVLDRLLYPNHPLPASVYHFAIPILGNLQVSCCGVFGLLTETVASHYESTIGFNLLSYRDFSILVLTIFKDGKHHLNSYVNSFIQDNHNYAKLINDIAFSKCEEPLLASVFWKRLSQEQKLNLRYALLPPSQRQYEKPLDLIKIPMGNIVKNLTSEILNKMPPDLREIFIIHREDILK